MWVDSMPEQAPALSPGLVQRYIRRVQRGIAELLFSAVMVPMLAAAWLSPGFRKERQQNRLKRQKANREASTVAPYTLKEATVALVSTCRTAKARGSMVLYAWSL
jgi:hypothetical protein